MTKKQRKAVRRALREPGSRAAGWDGVLGKVRDYYAHTDPVCWELLRLLPRNQLDRIDDKLLDQYYDTPAEPA